ncbi:MAG: tetratricopeptide repeat protein [Myxococcota bacterium]
MTPTSVAPALRRGVLLLACLALGAGCAFSNAMSRGEDAMHAGDYDRAVAAYSEAVSIDPGDRDARAMLAKAKAGAVSMRLGGARDALAHGDLVGAARAAHESHQLLPDEPQVVRLLDDVTAAVVTAGRADVQQKRFADARDLYADVNAAMPESHDALDREDDLAIAAWVGQLTTGRDAATKAGRLADALLQERQIIELQPSAVERARCGQLRTQLRSRYEVIVQQDPGEDDDDDIDARRPDGRHEVRHHHREHGGPLDQLTAIGKRLAGASDVQWLRVLSPLDPPGKGPVVGYSMREPRIQFDRQVTQRSGQFEAGKRELPNPDYGPVQRRLQGAEGRTSAAVAEVGRQEGAQAEAQKAVDREGPTPDAQTPAEDALAAANARLEHARQELQAARQELQAARDAAAQVPPFIYEPVFKVHTYDVETQTVRISTVLTTNIGTRAKPGAPMSRPIIIEVSDAAWAPQPVLGLPGDPMTLPSERELRAQLLDAVTAEIQHEIVEAFDMGIADQRAHAMSLDGDQRMEQLVAYLLMDPAIVDAEADALIWEVRGIPNAAALVDTCGSL